MTTPEVHFYFDYLSPYAYFAWRQLQPLCQRYCVDLRPHPVVFGKLLDHWGQLGPAEIDPKKTALYKYCYTQAIFKLFHINVRPYLSHTNQNACIQFTYFKSHIKKKTCCAIKHRKGAHALFVLPTSYILKWVIYINQILFDVKNMLPEMSILGSIRRLFTHWEISIEQFM